MSYEQAFNLGEHSALSRLITAKGWIDSWENFEFLAVEVEKDAYSCNVSDVCRIESAFGLEYTNVPISVAKSIHSQSPTTKLSEYLIHPHARSNIWGKVTNSKSSFHRRLRVGIISSDFGVHPVSSLIRGVVQYLNKSKIELFCFSVTDADSWWRQNMSQTAEHFDVLHGINSQDGASIIASKKIDILIDLNGHTKNTGLAYLSHRPAPVQMSYLGLPMTTAAQYVDYYIGDAVALPPEHYDHFSESLVLLPPCYIVNDYAQLQGDVVLHYSNDQRAPRHHLGTEDDILDLLRPNLLFGTISNSQKMDPNIFNVWMNILRRFSDAAISWTQHKGMSTAIKNLRLYARHYGIPQTRIILADLAPWLDHLYKKTSVDLFLDTSVKNGHTTGLDGIWAGQCVLSPKDIIVFDRKHQITIPDYI